MQTYTIVYTGEFYITVEDESEMCAREQASELLIDIKELLKIDEIDAYFKVRDSFIM